MVYTIITQIYVKPGFESINKVAEALREASFSARDVRQHLNYLIKYRDEETAYTICETYDTEENQVVLENLSHRQELESTITPFLQRPMQVREGSDLETAFVVAHNGSTLRQEDASKESATENEIEKAAENDEEEKFIVINGLRGKVVKGRVSVQYAPPEFDQAEANRGAREIFEKMFGGDPERLLHGSKSNQNPEIAKTRAQFRAAAAALGEDV